MFANPGGGIRDAGGALQLVKNARCLEPKHASGILPIRQHAHQGGVRPAQAAGRIEAQHRGATMVFVEGDDLREAGVTRAGGVDKLGQGSGGRVCEHICDMNPIQRHRDRDRAEGTATQREEVRIHIGNRCAQHLAERLQYLTLGRGGVRDSRNRLRGGGGESRGIQFSIAGHRQLRHDKNEAQNHKRR